MLGFVNSYLALGRLSLDLAERDENGRGKEISRVIQRLPRKVRKRLSLEGIGSVMGVERFVGYGEGNGRGGWC